MMKALDFFKNSWEKLKVEVKNDFENEVFYSKYFLNTVFLKQEDDVFFILVPNLFVKEVIEKDYLNLLTERFSAVINSPCKLQFVLESESKLTLKESKEKKPEVSNKSSNLNSKFSFEDLISGDFNNNAIKACKVVINEENPNWNILFIYGSTGLGKTHLLNASGLEFSQNHPDKTVLLISTEDFLRNAYSVISQGGKEIENFKDSFNDVDLFLVDDIQFLSNKEKLNEIFFSIFNNLVKQDKKIIMTSDKVPESLKIDDRMISRFNSGLSIKIGKPSTKTIVEIIKLKLNKQNRKNEFTIGAINYISNRYNQDIRSLEGIINRVMFFVNTSMNANEIVNEDKIKQIIEGEQDIFSINNRYSINPEVIIENICSSYNVKTKNVVSKQRNQQITFVRKICMYVLREKLSLSYNEIGSYFSNRNHTTVMDSCKDVEKLIEKDENLKIFINNLLEKM